MVRHSYLSIYAQMLSRVYRISTDYAIPSSEALWGPRRGGFTFHNAAFPLPRTNSLRNVSLPRLPIGMLVYLIMGFDLNVSHLPLLYVNALGSCGNPDVHTSPTSGSLG